MYSWGATRNPVPDSTYHLADLKIVNTESQNVSPSMTATLWSRVNWKICNENSTFACFDAICTQFSVTWPHCGTVHDFLAVLTDPACRHESDFSQRDGSDSTCMQCHVSIHQSPSLCNAILNTCLCLLAISSHGISLPHPVFYTAYRWLSHMLTNRHIWCRWNYNTPRPEHDG